MINISLLSSDQNSSKKQKCKMFLYINQNIYNFTARFINHFWPFTSFNVRGARG